MNLDTVTLIATVPAIIALVNLAKRFGVKDQWATLLAVVLGVLLNVADYAWHDTGWYAAATTGLILGLGAAGLYDVTNKDAPAIAVLTTENTGVAAELLPPQDADDDDLVQGAQWPDNWPPSEATYTWTDK